MRHFLTSLVAFVSAIALLGSPAAFAAPIAYSTVNIAADTPQAPSIALITAINASSPAYATTVTCTGTTTATCTGLRAVISVTGLTTAAGVTAAAMTVTDTSVTASSMVFCQALGYAGTGNPVAVNVVPSASTIVFNIQNTHASAALNATVPVACFVYN
jgi:hypothetical protein